MTTEPPADPEAEVERRWLEGLRRLLAAVKAHPVRVSLYDPDGEEFPILTPNHKGPATPAGEGQCQ